MTTKEYATLNYIKVVYWLTNTFIVAGLLCLALSISYFLHGSLEEFPTEEQQGKVKIGTSMMIFFFTLLEIVLFAIRGFVKKRIHVRMIKDSDAFSKVTPLFKNFGE